MPRPKPNMHALLDRYVFQLGYSLEDTPVEDTFNCNTLFRVICKHNKEHVFTTNMTELSTGKKDISVDCPHCQKEKQYNKKRISWSVVESYAKRNNLDVSPRKDFYSKWEDKITFICRNCKNEHMAKSLAYWSKNNKFDEVYECQKCNEVSKAEDTNKFKHRFGFLEYVREVYTGSPIIINHKLSDFFYSEIFIKKHSVAFHYVDHNTIIQDEYRENYKSSCERFLEYQNKDIHLITLFDDEWQQKREICESRIKNLMGLTENRIYARKCEVRRIENKTALLFNDKYHIQGRGQCKEAYGLFYDDLLVSVMSFSKPSAAKGKSKDYDWELNRFCSSLNTIVVGGASKLFKAFREAHKGERLVSFCDLRWDTGGVYEQLGMELDYITKPNYYYIGEYTNWVKKHRFNFTKANVMRIFNETDESLTELEIAEKNGLFRLYDCGHKKFRIGL